LKEVYADPIVEPTVISAVDEQQGGSEEAHITMESEASVFSVSENGELIQGTPNENDNENTPGQEQDPTT
jgi:hypothetical protein